MAGYRTIRDTSRSLGNVNCVWPSLEVAVAPFAHWTGEFLTSTFVVGLRKVFHKATINNYLAAVAQLSLWESKRGALLICTRKNTKPFS